MKTNHVTNIVGAVCITALAAAILAGCSTQTAHSDEPPAPFFQQIYQKLDDGRTVLCLYREGGIHGYSYGATPSVSCDWAGAIVHK